MKGINRSLLVVLGLVIALLVWLLLDSRGRLSEFKSQISKFDKMEQSFNERIEKDSIRIIEQEQMILSQKDAIDLGLLEIDRLKKIKSKVEYVTVIKIDTLYIPFETVLEVHDTIYPKGSIMTPKRFKLSSEFYGIKGLVLENGLKIDSLAIPNEVKITVGEKRNGFLKKPTSIVEVTNTNPYIKTLEMNNVVIQEDKKIYQKKAFWFGVGIVGGILIAK